jgi:hypothetical protein
MFWQPKPKEFWKLKPKELRALWGSEQKEVADWHKPETACALLDEIGLKTNAYKNYDPDFSANEFACFSHYKEIGRGRPMPNNLAYYVTGDQHAAKELKLVLNVNDRDNAEDGHRALAIASGLLAKNALGKYLMEEAVPKSEIDKRQAEYEKKKAAKKRKAA